MPRSTRKCSERLSEVDRIASVTAFNGQKVLDGSFGTALFQVGANVGETISISLAQGVKASQIGQIATSTTRVTSTALTGTGTIQVGNGQVKSVSASVAGAAAGQTAGSAYAKAAAITAAGVPGLTVQATNYKELGISAVTAAAGTISLRINDVAIYSSVATTTGLSTQEITDAINGKSATTGVTAGLSGGKLFLTAADGRDIKIGYDLATSTGGLVAGADTVLNGVTYTAGTLDTVANSTSSAGVGTAQSINNGSITLSASQAISIVNDGTALGASATINVDTTTLATQNVLTVAAANSAMAAC